MGPSGGPAAAIPAGIFVLSLVVCVTRSTVFFKDFNLPAAFDILIDLIRKQVGNLDVMQRSVWRAGRRSKTAGGIDSRSSIDNTVTIYTLKILMDNQCYAYRSHL